MDSISVDLLENVSNNVVIRIPGRRFPGMVIQGDTLNNLYVLAAEVDRLVQDTGSDNLKELSHELRQQLFNAISIYEIVLKKHDIELPYKRK